MYTIACVWAKQVSSADQMLYTRMKHLNVVTLPQRIALFCKGLAMGAADVVPGVSGGTIAFITGIYEELLRSIKGINFGLVRTLKNDGLKATWKQANGSFLLTLFAGIGISILSLSKVINHLLDTHAHLLWAFFFGLVVASVWLVGKQVDKWSAKQIIGLIAGTAVAFWITTLPPFSPSGSYPYLFVCGAIAICAMILPGISGSFILLLLGAYSTFMTALAEGDYLRVVTLAAGAGVGLILFSRVLTWAFDRARNFILAVLTGFLIGSLNKLWPWKTVQTVFVKHAGEADESHVSLVEQNVAPSGFAHYSDLGNQLEDGTFETLNHTLADPQVMLAAACALGGLALILGMEWGARKFGMDA